MRKVLSLCCCIVMALGACSRQRKPSSLREEMGAAHNTVYSLYSFVWNPEAFADPSSAEKIQQLLRSLGERFHRIDAMPLADAQEPGFRAALNYQNAMIREIEFHFAVGEKDYANMRLRSLAGNCVACHSRYKVSVDFLGSPPPPAPATERNRFAAAEYYFATRQFEKAAAALEQLAASRKPDPYDRGTGFRALKLWLVIMVRVKERPGEAAAQLDALRTGGVFSGHQQQAIERWIADLKELERRQPPNQGLLLEARSYLAPELEEHSQLDDELRLVRTLRATAVLHTLLRGRPSQSVRSEATFLLAKAYVHIPIQALQVLRELYLAQVIYDVPGSNEAQAAFRMYEEYKRLIYGTDGDQIQLSPAEKLTLEELRGLAFDDAA